MVSLVVCSGAGLEPPAVAGRSARMPKKIAMPRTATMQTAITAGETCCFIELSPFQKCARIGQQGGCGGIILRRTQERLQGAVVIPWGARSRRLEDQNHKQHVRLAIF